MAVVTDPYLPAQIITGGSGFNELSDTPTSYAGQAGKIPAVNAAEDGLEFIPNSAIPYNLAINGDFRIWQRGTSFTTSTGTYTADRWRQAFTTGTPVYTVDQGNFTTTQTEVPDSPEYYLELDLTDVDTATQVMVSQRVEDLKQFAQQEVILSFWIRTPDYATTMYSAIAYNYGSGGSATETFTQENVIVTNVWTKVEHTITVGDFSAKTFGADNYLEITPFRMDTALENPLLVGAVDIANVQLEINDTGTASDFVKRSFGIELGLCQRYFAKTFDRNVVPADNAGFEGAIGIHRTTLDYMCANWQFPVTMRAAPTVTTYNPSSGTAGHWYSGSGTIASQVLNEGEAMATIDSTGFGVSGTVHSIHATADAEL